MEMQYIPSNKNVLVNDYVLEGDRYYYKLKKEIVDYCNRLHYRFQLHNNSWTVSGFYTKDCISIIIYCQNTNDSLYDVQAGIVGDDRKEIIVSKATSWLDGRGKFQVRILGNSEYESSMLTDKVLYLFVEIKDLKGAQKIKKRKRNVETDYEELFLNGRNSDVTIEVKRRKFNCHKCILGARSPVFAAMMEHDMREKVSGVVTIEEAEPTTFQEFLLYLYTGNKSHLSWKNVTDMYKLAHKYDVEDLEDLCVEHMKKNLTTENFYDFFLVSHLHSNSELIDTTTKFFLEKSKEIIESEKWLAFLSENPTASNALIKALVYK